MGSIAKLDPVHAGILDVDFLPQSHNFLSESVIPGRLPRPALEVCILMGCGSVKKSGNRKDEQETGTRRERTRGAPTPRAGGKESLDQYSGTHVPADPTR